MTLFIYNTVATEMDKIFFTKCVPARTAIVAAAALTPAKYKPLWAIPATIGVVGYAYRGLTYDPEQRGLKGPVWWNAQRLPHILLLIVFIILAVTKSPLMWVAPTFDLMYGIENYVDHYHPNLT